MMSTTSASRGATPEVLNQPPPLLNYNAFDADIALRDAVAREGAAWGLDRARLGDRGLAFGDLPSGVDGAAIVERSLAL
jgi:hypothetical protein